MDRTSKKYDLEEVEGLAFNNHLKFKKHYLDCKHYFTNTSLIK
jgi:hypothetical protein